MAKYSRGILGPVRGTVGTVVGSSWRAIDYVRSKASGYSDRKSEAQVAQRGKFKKHVRFARGLLVAARVGLRGLAQRSTEFNIVVRRLFDVGGDVRRLRLSSGVYAPIEGLAVQVSGQAAVVTWTGPQGADGDAAYVAVAASDESYSTSRRVALRDGRAEFTLPAGAIVDTAFAFTADALDEQVSDTAVATV